MASSVARTWAVSVTLIKGNPPFVSLTSSAVVAGDWGSEIMSSKNGDPIESSVLKTLKSTLFDDRKMTSASARLDGALASVMAFVTAPFTMAPLGHDSYVV